MAELGPLLRLLFDDVSITFDEKTLLPQTILRNGQEEEVDRLSGGMREQLSVLTRLAFARLLARDVGRRRSSLTTHSSIRMTIALRRCLTHSIGSRETSRSSFFPVANGLFRSSGETHSTCQSGGHKGFDQ